MDVTTLKILAKMANGEEGPNIRFQFASADGNDVICSFEMRPSMPAVMMRQACEFMFDEMQWPDRPQKEAGRIGISYNPV